MPSLFFGEEKDGEIVLDVEETRHVKVVRIKEGNVIRVTDGKGFRYVCIVERIGRRETVCRVLEKDMVETESEDRLIAVVPAGRWERLRLLIEKSVELGVDAVIVHRFRRSQREYGYDKIFNVVKEASKQCGRYLFPEIKVSRDLEEFLEQDVKYYTLDPSGTSIESVDFKGSVGIITGPEGGFDEGEKDILRSKTKFISLGKKMARGWAFTVTLSPIFFSWPAMATASSSSLI